MKKADVILLVSILLAALLCFGGYALFFRDDGNTVEITVDGNIYKTLSLETNTTIDIPSGKGQTNRLEIKNGKANMIEADCPDKLCVHQKQIEKNGETLVCLPHKVIVTMRSQKENTLDGISQ
ncbi:MAG: NusG domain II-containing protein [Lachnospiraceae bacterium]|nr:NusG domain II-containing protein [Lachnospiraceae bacterium]